MIKFIVLNVAGGIVVLGSYLYILTKNPELKVTLWGSIPKKWIPIYQISMLGAALGYFLFTSYFLTIDLKKLMVFGKQGVSMLLLIYAVILIPSTLWMPLTAQYLSEPSGLIWFLIRIVLFLVGVASVVILMALIYSEPKVNSILHKLAIVGAGLFIWQTSILDAFIWPIYFR